MRVEDDLIKLAAARCGLTVKALAEKLGIPVQTLKAAQQRKRLTPAIAALMRLLKEHPEVLADSRQ